MVTASNFKIRNRCRRRLLARLGRDYFKSPVQTFSRSGERQDCFSAAQPSIVVFFVGHGDPESGRARAPTPLLVVQLLSSQLPALASTRPADHGPDSVFTGRGELAQTMGV